MSLAGLQCGSAESGVEPLSGVLVGRGSESALPGDYDDP